jgi:hypothetical protein
MGEASGPPDSPDDRPRSGFRPPLHGAAAALLVGLLSGCQSTAVNAWNLKEVHDPDGTPKRVGAVHGALQHRLVEFLRVSAFGSPEFLDPEPEPIEDPLGVCYDNVTELVFAKQEDPVVYGRTAELLCWLGVDCTYVLSRERMGLALGELGPILDVTGPYVLPEGVEPAGVQDVGKAISGLLRHLTDVLRTDDAPSFEDLDAPAGDLADACEAVRALELDRDGTRRLLAVTTLVFNRESFGSTELAPLAALHRELAARAVGLTLAAMLTDPEPRVRASAITSWSRMVEGRSGEPLEAALRDGHADVVLAAVRSLTRYGPPDAPPADSAPEETARSYWTGQLVFLLTRRLEGPLQVATCRALSALSGEPADLHPEIWMAWWDEIGGADPNTGARP